MVFCSLLMKYHEHFTFDTIEDIKKKINNLRTNFRYENRNTNKIFRSGASFSTISYFYDEVRHNQMLKLKFWPQIYSSRKF